MLLCHYSIFEARTAGAIASVYGRYKQRRLFVHRVPPFQRFPFSFSRKNAGKLGSETHLPRHRIFLFLQISMKAAAVAVVAALGVFPLATWGGRVKERWDLTPEVRIQRKAAQNRFSRTIVVSLPQETQIVL